jgi:competence protein ComEC
MNRATPFIRLLLPFIVGIALGLYVDREIAGLGWTLVLALILLCFLAWRRYAYRYRWVFGVLATATLLAAGYARAVWHSELRLPDHLANSTDSTTNIRQMIGVVEEPPTLSERLKVPIRLKGIVLKGDTAMRACTGRVLLFMEADTVAKTLQYGQLISVGATVRPTEPVKNPYAFDYSRYLGLQQIYHTAFVRSDSCRVLDEGYGYWFWRVAYQQRQRLLEVLDIYFPKPAEKAIAAALLTGYKAELPDELRQAYVDTGSMHALAVSGSHIAVLYMGLLYLLGFLRRGGRRGVMVQTIVVLGIIWAFTLLTGAPPSVLRASVMFSLFLLGQTFFRNTPIWNTLAASAFLLLVFNPYLLADPGFQLSYAAVGGMVLFFPYFEKATPPLPKYFDWIRSIFLVGVAAQLGTLPLSLYYFHQFPVYFWLAGWVVVVGGAVFLWGGGLLLALHAVWPAFAKVLGWLLSALVQGMNSLIVLIQSLPGSVLGDVWITVWEATLWYGVIGVVAMLLSRASKAHWWWAGLGLLLVLGAVRLWRTRVQLNQRTIVVYHVSGATLIDCFDGENVYTLTDTVVTQKRETFAAQANRQALGMRGQQQIYLGIGSSTIRQIEYEPPLLSFYDRRLVLLDRALPPPSERPVPVDAIVLCHNAPVSVEACLQQYPTRMVVIDASVSRRKAAAWVADCQRLNVTVHEVYQKGAWIEKE